MTVFYEQLRDYNSSRYETTFSFLEKGKVTYRNLLGVHDVADIGDIFFLYNGEDAHCPYRLLRDPDGDDNYGLSLDTKVVEPVEFILYLLKPLVLTRYCNSIDLYHHCRDRWEVFKVIATE